MARQSAVLAAFAVASLLCVVLISAEGEDTEQGYKLGRDGELTDRAKASEEARARGDAEREALGADVPVPSMESLKELERMRYGFASISNAVRQYEFFRATFGGLIPCGDFPMVPAPEDDVELCRPLPDDGQYKGAYLLALRGKCTFVEKARIAVAAGASGLLVANSEAGLLRMPAGSQLAHDILIPVVMLPSMAGDILHHATEMGERLNVSLTSSDEGCIDASGGFAVDVDAAGRTIIPSPQMLLAGGDVLVYPTPPSGNNAFEFYTSDFGGVVLTSKQSLTAADPIDACDDLTNGLERGCEGEACVLDKFVLVDRGVCPMVQKARNAQRAGALGVIIINRGGEGPVRALGDDEWGNIFISVVSVSAEVGDELLAGQFEAQLVPRDLPRTVWEQLTVMDEWSDEMWGKGDKDALSMLLSRQVSMHHPASITGHWQRYELLRQIAARAGVDEELEHVATDVAAALKLVEDEREATAAALEAEEEAARRSVAHSLARGVAPVLSRTMTSSIADFSRLGKLEGLPGGDLLCQRYGGERFAVDIKPMRPSDGRKELASALRSQACLERLLLQHAVILGERINAQFKKANSEEEAHKSVQSAFYGAHVPTDERYEQIVRLYSMLGEMKASIRENDSVEEWLEEAEQVEV